MLKKRIVATLIIKDRRVVQSIGFNKYLPVGRADISAEFLNKWGIDEIVLLDIDATAQDKKPDIDLITQVSKKSLAPLTVGGGIKSVGEIRKLIRYGADKVSINKEAIKNPNIIREASKIFGSQCIVVSIDVKKIKGGYEVYSDSGRVPTGLNPIEWAKEVERLGAGEILLNSIDKDGLKSGYDIKIIKEITGAVSIPVIALGGAGHPKHFLEVLEEGDAMAAAAGNFFHFTEHSPITVKAYLFKKNIDVRIDTYADYEGTSFIEGSGRIKKRPEDYLNKLRFEYISDEII